MKTSLPLTLSSLALIVATSLFANNINSNVPKEVTEAFAKGFSAANTTQPATGNQQPTTIQPTPQQLAQQELQKQQMEAQKKIQALNLELQIEQTKQQKKQIEEQALNSQTSSSTQRSQQINQREYDNLISKEKIKTYKTMFANQTELNLTPAQISTVQTKNGTYFYVKYKDLETLDLIAFDITNSIRQALQIQTTTQPQSTQNDINKENELIRMEKGYRTKNLECISVSKDKIVFKPVL